MWFALSGIGSYLAHLNVCSGADCTDPWHKQPIKPAPDGAVPVSPDGVVTDSTVPACGPIGCGKPGCTYPDLSRPDCSVTDCTVPGCLDPTL